MVRMSAATPVTGSTLIPSLRYQDAPAAIDWLCQAFNFRRSAATIRGRSTADRTHTGRRLIVSKVRPATVLPSEPWKRIRMQSTSKAAKPSTS